jgi:hypothetical protein
MSRRLWVATAVLALTAVPARADVSYQYVTDQSSYTAAAGGTVTVQIFLQETVTPNKTTSSDQNQSLISVDGGLVGAGVFTKVSNGTAATITNVANNVATGAAKNSTNFDTGEKAVSTPTAASILEANTGAANTFGNTNSNVVTTTTKYQVLLGTLTINVGAAAGATTTFTVLPYKNTPTAPPFNGTGADNNTVTAGTGPFQGFPLDLDVTNNQALTGPPPAYKGANDATAFAFTVTAAAVPEPSSMLLCGLIACGGAFTAYRRRRAQKAAAAPAV